MPKDTAGAVEAQDADRLQENANAIRELGKKTIEQVIEIGRRLTEVKDDLLEHGEFGPWLGREFGWTERTAQNFMRVYKLSQSNPKRISDLNLPLAGIYLLARPSTSDEVRNEVLERAEAGEQISVATIKEAIAESKPEADDDAAVRAECAVRIRALLNQRNELESEPKAATGEMATTEADPADGEMSEILAARAPHTVKNGEPPPVDSKIVAVDYEIEFGPPAPWAWILQVWEWVPDIDQRRAFLARVGEQDLRAALPDEIRRAWAEHFSNNVEQQARAKAARPVKPTKTPKQIEREQRMREQVQVHQLYHAPAASEAKN
jgi:Protein of unknown function (DUF3102)